MEKVTDIRMSIIAGEGKHVAVHISDVQGVKKALGKKAHSFLKAAIAYSQEVLAEHPDAHLVDVTPETAMDHLAAGAKADADEQDGDEQEKDSEGEPAA